MKAILDTNILISAVASAGGAPGLVLDLWYRRKFDLLTHAIQLEELRETSRYPHLAARLSRPRVGRLVNDLQKVALWSGELPDVDASPDPDDNYLLALAQARQADYLISGDKADLLALRRHGATRIVTAREFLALLTA
jgi:putative PIN family toxin of toxin-antitoxin system